MEEKTVSRTEVKFLNKYGNPVEPELACRIIRISYDEDGIVINTTISFDPQLA